MKKLSRKSLAIMLSLFMTQTLLFVFAMPAQAANFTANSLSTLQTAMTDALSHADAASTITITGIITLNTNGSYTIDGTGKTITLLRGTATDLFNISYFNLTLKNIIIDGNNSVYSSNSSSRLFRISDAGFNNAILTMESGAILQNNMGGGVIVVSGTFNMHDGEIKGNTASTLESYGAGVYNSGTFIMTGGRIQENSCQRGAGLYNEGVFTMTGGYIFSNRITNSGGEGVWQNTTNAMTLGGAAWIIDNTYNSSPVTNLRLGPGAYITLGTGANAPDRSQFGMDVGVYKTDDNYVFVSSGAVKADEELFTSEVSGRFVHLEGAQLRLVVPAVTVAAQSGQIKTGTGGSATFAVTTNMDGSNSITWHNSDETSASAPTGITPSLSAIVNDAATLTMTGDNSVVAGTYYFKLTIDGITSSLVTLTVTSVPVFTTQPTNQNKLAGENATFTVAASGSPTPTYQWQSYDGSNWNDISGETNATLTLTSVAATDDGNKYRCVATNSEGSATSNEATLTISTIAVVTVSTQSGLIATITGGTATFNVSTNRSGAGSITWHNSDSSPASTPTGITSSYNETLSTVTVTGSTSVVEGTYYFILTINGTASSLVTLTVISAPVFTTQPTNQNKLAGENATFTVAASGSPTPTYQWQLYDGSNWNDISGETNATLTLTSVAATDDGNKYRCVATNSAGASATSNEATLTVTTVPVCEIVHTNSTTTQYGSIGAAFVAVATGETIRLLDDINHPDQIYINGITVTLETNGFTLDINTTSQSALFVSGGGKLILDNSAGGEFNVASSDTNGYGVYATDSGSEVEVTNATTTGSGGGTGSAGVHVRNSAKVSVSGDVNGVICGALIRGGILTVGGNVVATTYDVDYGCVDVYYSTDEITIDGAILVPAGVNYIQFNLSLIKSASDYETVTTKQGYLTYDGSSVSSGTVWVKSADATAPTLAAGAVDRINDTDATVKFTSNEAGTYYWQLDGAAPTGASLATAGTNATSLTAAEQTITLNTLTIGGHTIYIVAEDASGNISNLLTITIPSVTTYTASVSPTNCIFPVAGYGYDNTGMTQQITINNTGTGPITGISIVFGGGAGSTFEIIEALSPTTINPGSAATFGVRPKMQLGVNNSPYNDVMTIHWTNDGGTGLTVNLSFTVNNMIEIIVTANSGESTYGEHPGNPGLSATRLDNGESVYALTGLYNNFYITSTTPPGSYLLEVKGTLTNPNYIVTKILSGIWRVNKIAGSNVSEAPGISGKPTSSGITLNAVNILDNPGNQTVEYAISTEGGFRNETLVALVWQADTIFTGDFAEGMYYAYARSAENEYYAAGAAQVSVAFIVERFTGMDNPLQANALNAWVENGTLHVGGLTVGKPWSVYNLAGMLIYRDIAKSDVETWHDSYLQNHGIFIIQSEGRTVKVVTRDM